MTAPRLIAVLLMVFGLQACAAFTGVTPTNLEPLLVGSHRADVEAVLGEPSETKPNGCGSVDTYDYNRGRGPEPTLVALGMVHPAAPLVVGLVSHPFLYYGQKADLDVVYDPNDTVIKYGPRDPRDWDGLFSNNHLWVDQTTHEDVARRYHRIAMTETANPDTARHCLCHAARLGHTDSQFYLAGMLDTGPSGRAPAMALAGFETAAANAPPPAISEMSGMETGVVPQASDPPPEPPVIPAELIAGACAAQNHAPPANTPPPG